MTEKLIAVNNDSGNEVESFGYFEDLAEAVMFAVGREKVRNPENVEVWNRSKFDIPGSPFGPGPRPVEVTDPVLEYFDDLTDCGWNFYPVREVAKYR